MQAFKKDGVLLDYHGKGVTKINDDQYCLQPGVLSEHVLQIADRPRRLLDAQMRNACYKMECLPGSFSV